MMPTRLDYSGHQEHFIQVLRDKLTIKYVGRGNHVNDVGSVQTDLPAPRHRRIFYFEVEVVNAGVRGQITVGFSGRGFPLYRQPGWEHK